VTVTAQMPTIKMNQKKKHTNDNKDTASNVSALESKIAEEEEHIEKISLEKEFEKISKKKYLC